MLLSFFASQYKQVSGSKEFLSAVLEEAGTGTEENQIYASVSIFCRLLAALAPEALPALPGHGDTVLESPSIALGEPIHRPSVSAKYLLGTCVFPSWQPQADSCVKYTVFDLACSPRASWNHPVPDSSSGGGQEGMSHTRSQHH